MIQVFPNSTSQPSIPWMDHWQNLLSRPEGEFARISAQESNWTDILKRAQSIESPRILVLGVGGSSLGAQMIEQSLPNLSRRQMIYLDVPDPSIWASVQPMLDGSEHLIITSKSGGTLETLAWVEKLAAFNPRLLTPVQCTVIASPGDGDLQTWARSNGVECLWIPNKIGGRFSVLTAVGMLPAALLGLNLEEFRAGAQWAVDRPELAAMLAGDAVESWERSEWITQSWAFSGALKCFGEWWQQLWSESLGKKMNRLGESAPRTSSPIACTGPRDQHSMVQQLLDGARDKFVYISRVTSFENDSEVFESRLFANLPYAKKSISLGAILQAEASAFEQSLTEVGVKHATIQIESLSEKSLGAMIMLWQMTVALLGEQLNINAFDQPGVELGKKYAAKILRS